MLNNLIWLTNQNSLGCCKIIGSKLKNNFSILPFFLLIRKRTSELKASAGSFFVSHCKLPFFFFLFADSNFELTRVSFVNNHPFRQHILEKESQKKQHQTSDFFLFERADQVTSKIETFGDEEQKSAVQVGDFYSVQSGLFHCLCFTLSSVFVSSLNRKLLVFDPFRYSLKCGMPQSYYWL